MDIEKLVESLIRGLVCGGWILGTLISIGYTILLFRHSSQGNFAWFLVSALCTLTLFRVHEVLLIAAKESKK